MKKVFFIAIGLLLLLVFVFIYGKPENFIVLPEENGFDSEDPFLKEKITVAICPTFHYMLDESEEINGIRVIETENTSQSIELLKRREVDLIISGRPLRDNEQEDFLFEIIGEGYDFIFKNEIVIGELEMPFVPFYTNLDLEKIIKDFEHISENNIEKINNVNDYLDKGVVITFLENEMIGEPVHIIKRNGERVWLSRRPRMYYFSDINKDVLERIKNIAKEY